MNDTLTFVRMEDGLPVNYSFFGGKTKADARANLGLGVDDPVAFNSVTLRGEPSHFEGGFYVDPEAQYGWQPDGTLVAKNVTLFPNLEVTGSRTSGAALESLLIQLDAAKMIVNSTTA